MPDDRVSLNDEVLRLSGLDERSLRKPNMAERAKFLILIAEGFSIKRAAEALNKPRGAFAQLLETDEAFRKRYEQAFESSGDLLEDEAWRRAHERGRYRLGSDRLLELGLKARRPWRYGDKVEVGGPGGGAIRATVVHVDHAAVLDVLEQAGLISPGPLSLPAGDAEAAA